MTFSTTVSPRNSPTPCRVRAMPIPASRCGRRSRTGRPCRSTWPVSGRTNPPQTLNRVVLPAPFGPITPWTAPPATDSDTSSSATSPPNRTPTRSTANTGTSSAGGFTTVRPPGLSAVTGSTLWAPCPTNAMGAPPNIHSRNLGGAPGGLDDAVRAAAICRDVAHGAPAGSSAAAGRGRGAARAGRGAAGRHRRPRRPAHRPGAAARTRLHRAEHGRGAACRLPGQPRTRRPGDRRPGARRRRPRGHLLRDRAEAGPRRRAPRGGAARVPAGRAGAVGGAAGGLAAPVRRPLRRRVARRGDLRVAGQRQQLVGAREGLPAGGAARPQPRPGPPPRRPQRAHRGPGSDPVFLRDAAAVLGLPETGPVLCVVAA